MPDFDPNQPRWTGDAAIPQQQRFASGPSFPPTRSGIQAYKTMQAQKLHEATFGEKSQLDFAKLDIAQQKLLIDKAAAVEKITAGNHSREMEGRRALSSAAAIEKLGTLDHTDPKFEQKLSQILGQYPDALNSQSLMQAVSGQRSLAQAYTKALHERTAASFGDPMAKAAYEKTLADTKDPHLANIAAQATAEQVKQAKNLYGSADLTPQERAQIFDPTKGTFDFSQLNTLQMAVAQRNAAREAASPKDISPLTTALDHVNKMTGTGPEFEKWKAATIYNLQQGMKNASFNTMNGTVAPGATAPAAAGAVDPFAKYTGAPIAQSAAQPAATPAPTPGETPAPTPGAAPTPAPAATPIVTAAAPDGDMATRFTGSTMDAPILNDPRFAQASGAAVAQPADPEESEESDENTQS